MEQAFEYFGVLTGLLYLWLEIKQHKAMWIVGFVSSLAYVFVFLFSKFYAVMALNVYYTLISVYGFLLWTREKGASNPETEKTEGKIQYRRMSPAILLGCSIVTLALFGGIYFVLNTYTDSPVAFGDAFITALSIVATWLLARRIIEHWPCWVVVNGVSVYLYATRALYPTMFLYICYTALAVVGFYNWKKKGVNQDEAHL
jgi:nicotinamide mononucleotide transporter